MIIHLLDSLDQSSCRTLSVELMKIIEGESQYAISMKPFAMGEISCPIALMHDREQDIYQRLCQFDNPTVIYHRAIRDDMNFLQRLQGKIPLIIINYRPVKDGKLNAPYFSRMVCYCESIQKSLIDNGFQCDLVPPPIRLEQFNTVAAKIRQRGDYLLTGRLNTFTFNRYNDEWFRFIADLRLSIPLTHEHIGGGAYFHRAKAAVKTLKGKQNRIRLLGPISDFDEKISLVKSWDAMIYLTLGSDSVSASVLESLASGTPVICSANSVNRSYIEQGRTGYLFRDLRELGEILRTLSENRDQLSDMRKATLEKASQWTFGNNAKTIFSQIISNARDDIKIS